MRLRHAALAVALLSLAACGPKTGADKAPETPAAKAVAPAGFQHDPTFDAAGYYRTPSSVQINGMQLNQIAIGAPSDFAEWEAGKREGVFGPIVIEFDALSSPTVTNELGANVHTVRAKVLPQSYRLYPGEVSFSAVDPKFGPVVFEGKFDQTVFADAHKTGASGNTPVLTGTLTFGTNTIRDIQFVFWAGD